MKGIVEKAIIIGLDAAMPNLVMKFVNEGILPHTARLIKEGIYSEALAPLPGLTHPNWVSIATGSWPGTHGVTCHTIHRRGEPLDKIHNAYTSDYCHAEFLWDAAERVGKRSIILKYLCSWPPTIKTGVQVAGHGYSASITGSVIIPCDFFSTNPSEKNRIELIAASGWKSLPNSRRTPMESRILFSSKRGENLELKLLVLALKSEHYDTVILSPSKDVEEKLAEISVGQWSSWIRLGFRSERGLTEGTVRFKLLELSPDAENLKLFYTEIHQTSGFTFPESLGPELINHIGPYYDILHTPGADEVTREEVIRYQANWLSSAATYLMKKYEWSLFFMHWWATDDTGHRYLHRVDPTLPTYVEEKVNTFWSLIRRDYQITDTMIGEIIKCADENTLVILISDHGMQCGKQVFLGNALAQAGLLSFKRDSTGRSVIDWSKTKAFAQRSVHIYVNLKGRDPSGIVEPSEYDMVREQIIDALYELRDPESGRRMVALALKREDAGILGMYGDNVGDVVYAMAPGYTAHFPFAEWEVYGREYRGYGKKGDWRETKEVLEEGFTAFHGTQLPGVSYGLSSERALLIMSGPGLKRGYTVSRPVWIIDVAPTISYLLNMPRPRDADGDIIWDALECESASS